MPVDTSIYQNLLRPPKSAAEYSNELDQADLSRGQLQAQKVNLIGAQQDLEDNQKLRALYQRPGFDPLSSSSLSSIYAASPKAGVAAQKAMLESQKTQAEVQHLGAQTNQADAATASSNFELARKKLTTGMQIVTTAADPASAHAGFRQAVQQGLMTPEEAAAKEQEIPNDPAGFQKWRESSALALLTAKDRFDLLDKQQQRAETNRHNTTTEANTVRGQDVAAKTARDNNANTIAKDYKVAGLDANGNFPGGDAGGGQFAGLIDSIGTGKVDEKTALARTPPGVKAQILAGVQAKYPEYDPSTYAAKVKAARDFTSGTQGNALRSFAVAGQHLDQLGTLVDALGNGQYQIVNKLGNAYAAQTGATAPTNFDAAKDVVSKEVTKAIVAGGGGVAERAELANLMSNAKSPAQLKGVITQYRGLMSAQHDALLQQRRGAGLPDSTLPAYSRDTAAALPPEIAEILKKNGVK